MKFLKNIIAVVCLIAILFSCVNFAFATGGLGGYQVAGFWESAFNGGGFGGGSHGKPGSFGGGGFGGSSDWSTAEDMKNAYSDYVSTLPATGYSSAGALLWQPRWIEDALKFNYFSFSWADMSYVSTSSDKKSLVLKSSAYTGSPTDDSYARCDGSQMFLHISYSLGNASIKANTCQTYWNAPISGYYTQLGSYPCVRGAYRVYNASTKAYEINTLSSDFDLRSANYYIAGDSKFLFQPGYSKLLEGYSCFGADYILYTPVYQIIPVDTSIGNTTYNINTRVNNFNGDYYDSVTNNYYNNTTIVNETNNTYYDMSTNTTQNMTSWNYDYKSRTYFITLEDGTTVAVQFGDNELTITKNDETSNTYNYVIKNNSGGDTPDTPTTCKHNWVETIDTVPTCLEGGHASYTCSLCKETYEQVLPANGHTWTVKEHVNTVFDTDGTVLTQGHTLYECSVCGEQFYTDTGAPPPDVSGSGTVIAWLNNFQTWLDGRLNLAFNFNLDSIIDKLDVIIEGTSESVENRINVTIDASNDAHNVFYITGEDGEEQSVTEFTGDLTKASGRLLSLLYRLVFADALSTVDSDLDGFEDFYTSQGEETATQDMNAPYEEENVWLAS